MDRKLRIAYRGNYVVDYTTETFVSYALEQLGHEVLRLQEDKIGWEQVLEQALDCDMFLWQRTWNLDPNEALRVLEALGDHGIPTVSYHLDRYFGLAREDLVRTDPFFRTALVVTADGGNELRYQEMGINHLWMPPGVHEPHCHDGQPRPDLYPHDVVFVGSYPYPHPEWAPVRKQMIERLQKEFGDRFGLYPQYLGRAIRGTELSDLYRTAKVVVGDSCLIDNPYRYLSDRVPEVLGRGALLVHPHVDGMFPQWYADKEHLLAYRLGEWEEMLMHVYTGLDMKVGEQFERERIGKAGRELVLIRDTVQHRMATLLSHVEKELGFPDRSTPKAPQITPKRQKGFHPPSGLSCDIEVVQGTTDAHAVEEVWDNDAYRVTAEKVDGRLVIDLGANCGAFSLLAAKLGASVVAYEPNPENYAALVRNMAEHSPHHFTPQMAAVSWHEEVSLAGEGSGTFTTPGTGTEAHDIVTIIGGVSVGFMKIDIEGAEYDLFHGNAGWLGLVDRIALEMHGPSMPHLRHLDDGNQHHWRFGQMVTKLAQYGHLEIHGKPSHGGLIYWTRYGVAE